jgi:maltodextrin utilization protein YvdJ
MAHSGKPRSVVVDSVQLRISDESDDTQELSFKNKQQYKEMLEKTSLSSLLCGVLVSLDNYDQ